MRLVRFVAADGRRTWGRLGADGTIVEEPRGALRRRELLDVLTLPPEALAGEIDAAGCDEHEGEAVQLLAPVERPSKVIGVGRNYREHAAERGAAEPTSPILFGILPSAVTGPSDDIVLPSLSKQIDWEGELGVVIGRRTKGIARRDVEDHIAGYIALNDVTARDLQKLDGQWTRAKSFDTFKPTGPCLTTVDELGLARELRIEVVVNGVRKQHASTAQMIFPVDELVSFVAAFCTLLPGDVIATGTPSGVGAAASPPNFLMSGDVLETRVEGIGALANRVVASPSFTTQSTDEATHV